MVTEAGIVLGDGWIQAGSGAASTVEMTADIAQLQQQLEAAEAQLAQLSGTLAGANNAAAEARVRAASAIAAVREFDTAVATARREHDQAAQRYTQAKSHYDGAAASVAASVARVAELHRQQAQSQSRLAALEQQDESQSGEVDLQQAAAAQARQQAAAALETARQREVETRYAARAAADAAARLAGLPQSLSRQAEQERAAQLRRQRQFQRQQADARLAQEVADQARTLGAATDAALALATQVRERGIATKTELSSRLHQAQAAVKSLSTAQEALRQQVNEATVAHAQAQVRLEEAAASLSSQLGMSADDLVNSHAPGADFDRAEAEAALAAGQRALDRLGKVNPLALEEFKALEERYNFLAQQLADIHQARQDLQEVISQVDDRILQLFSEAWEDVSAQFPQVFATLFPGGEARLILTDPQDMLATGIEVEARPPGKKVKRLSLLSGGEKSLTALAFLVAIFRARPSPFYVMDEVEAALDDVNLRRLIALFEQLRHDSQLIVITHQKATMDVANVLYGVTMRGDGITRVLSQRMTPAGGAPGSSAAAADAAVLGVGADAAGASP